MLILFSQVLHMFLFSLKEKVLTQVVNLSGRGHVCVLVLFSRDL